MRLTRRTSVALALVAIASLAVLTTIVAVLRQQHAPVGSVTIEDRGIFAYPRFVGSLGTLSGTSREIRHVVVLPKDTPLTLRLWVVGPCTEDVPPPLDVVLISEQGRSVVSIVQPRGSWHLMSQGPSRAWWHDDFNHVNMRGGEAYTLSIKLIDDAESPTTCVLEAEIYGGGMETP